MFLWAAIDDSFRSRSHISTLCFNSLTFLRWAPSVCQSVCPSQTGGVVVVVVVLGGEWLLQAAATGWRQRTRFSPVWLWRHRRSQPLSLWSSKLSLPPSVNIGLQPRAAVASPTKAHLHDDLTGDDQGRGNSGSDHPTWIQQRAVSAENVAFEDRRKNNH